MRIDAADAIDRVMVVVNRLLSGLVVALKTPFSSLTRAKGSGRKLATSITSLAVGALSLKVTV